MSEALSACEMAGEQDRRLSEAFVRERARLRNFIRRRVPDLGDAEDVVQDVFAELVEAYRLMKPIEQVGAWLFRVARNRITDLLRRRRPERWPEKTGREADGEALGLEELIPSPDAGPEASFARSILLEELEAALDELPKEQRETFIEHEIAGRSFKEIAARSGVSVNTLFSRKHYAVNHLRRRLRDCYEEWSKELRRRR